jgi:hypothetical protein
MKQTTNTQKQNTQPTNKNNLVRKSIQSTKTKALNPKKQR